MSTSAMQCGHN